MSRHLNQILARGALCALAGAATACSFAHASLDLACFFSVSPLFFAIGRDPRRAPRYAVVYALALYGVLLSWLDALVPDLMQLGLSCVAAFLGAGALRLAGALLMSALLALCFWPLGALSGAGALSAGCAMAVFCELLSERMGFLAFPWLRLGGIPFRHARWIQSASLWGVEGLSLVCACGNALLAALVLWRKRRCALLAALVLCLLLPCAWGARRVGQREGASRGQVECLLVQGGLGGAEKWRLNADDTLEHYLRLTRERAQPGMLVLWPETALPVDPHAAPQMQRALCAFCREQGICLIFGAFDASQGQLKNALYAILPDGTLSAPYHKRRLVPFGEALPALPLLRLFPLCEGAPGGVTPGEFARPLPTPWGNVGALVCYESLFSQSGREAAAQGWATVIASNDSWFAGTCALRQHFGHAVLRAAETGRPVLCCASTGITGFVDEKGRIRAVLGTFGAGTLQKSVALRQEATPYAQSPQILWAASALAYLGFAVRRMVSGWRSTA